MRANTPREIPPTPNPGKTDPERAPNDDIPDAEPGEDNPANPKEDEI